MTRNLASFNKYAVVAVTLSLATLASLNLSDNRVHADPLGGAIQGAIGGAIIGGIFGGGRGAARGAAIGGVIGLATGAAKAERRR